MREAPIDLERTFVDLPESENFDFDHAHFFYSASRQFPWERLLESDRVLIVSEAGVGKTVECRRQQERLWELGLPAFYIELSILAKAPLEEQLLPEEVDRFDRWKRAQTERATFFLDSIDELKLTPSAFDFALKRAASAIGTKNLDRAKIVLTTRPVAIDRELIERRLPIAAASVAEMVVPEDYFANAAMRLEEPKKEVSSPPTWRTVALSPLTEPQMLTLARHCGVTDPDRLLEAVEAQNAHEFTKRPLDFLELCGDWKAHGRIRSHREQVIGDIEAKLRQSQERAERLALAPERAREGAERLALAALLTRRFTIWHGRDIDRSRGDSALDPTRILADWTEDEVKTLLERSLFGFATYGRVRFHHRSVIEFLAAERLQRLIARGMPSKTLSRLLFTTTPVDLPIIKPTMAPVAAWLSVVNASVREEVLRRDPSLLLRMGDPAALSLADRIRALELYVERYGAGRWRGQDIPALQIRRLASPELGKTVATLWSPALENPEVRETLLQLIGAGKLTACAAIAYEAATASTSDLGPRLSGLLALAELKDARLSGLLDEMSSAPAAWSPHLVATTISHLFPHHMTVSQLVALLGRLPAKSRQLVGIPYMLPDAVVKASLSPSLLTQLGDGLVSLIESTLRWDAPRHALTTARKDVISTLLTVCRLQIETGYVGKTWAASVALALRLANNEAHAEDERKALRERLSSAGPALRESVFWAHDQLVRDREPADANRFAQVFYQMPLELVWERDNSWLRLALADVARSDSDRGLILDVIEWLLRGSSSSLQVLSELRPAVADQAELAEKLEGAIKLIENPPPEPRWMREDRRRRVESERKQAKNIAAWKTFWREIANDPQTAFGPERVHNTAHNLWNAMRNAGREGSGWNRGFIERAFDSATADKLREALKSRWRQDRPTTRSERTPEQRDTYLVIWTMGLAGLYAEAENPGWALALDSSEVELASRYALIELNELPAWVDDLIDADRTTVESLIGKELQGELTDATVRHSMLLQKIAHSSDRVLQLFIPRVREFLSSALDAHSGAEILDEKAKYAVQLLVKHGSNADLVLLTDTAAARLQGSPTQQEILFWLPLLHRVTPAAALDIMERIASTVDVARHSQVTAWFAELYGNRSDNEFGGLATLAEQPALLSRAVRLAYHHIRFSDDIEHEGAYSPDTRDHAERARSALMNMLLNAKGIQAWEAKIEVANDPAFAHFRDRALALAEQKMAEEWDATPFDESRVVQLEQQYEFPPANRADMSALLADRLSDVDDLLLQDISPRELWATIAKERMMRREVARALQNIARSAYHVNQEAITGDEKETDVRLISLGGPLEAVIELKVAEQGYTVLEYESALRDQLVKKYMAPEHRRVGCLLISISKDRSWEHPNDRRKLSLTQVLDHLNGVARSLVKELGADAFLSVRALDLRPRDLSGAIVCTTKKKRGRKASGAA